MDADRYHRARTALKHRQREAATLTAYMAALPPDRPTDIRDCLIEFVRAECDDATWQVLLDRATELRTEREVV